MGTFQADKITKSWIAFDPQWSVDDNNRLELLNEESLDLETFLFLISGPAGVGKTTICDRLLSEYPNLLNRVVTATTRKPRSGEVNGQDYHFLKTDEFERRKLSGDFIENETIHGKQYGVLKKSVLDLLDVSKVVLLNIDVGGARSIKDLFDGDQHSNFKLVSVFIIPKTLDALKERLLSRGTETLEDIDKRIQTATIELSYADNFDFVITSSDRQSDYLAIRMILEENILLK